MKNRAKRAREIAGLSIGQAVRILRVRHGYTLSIAEMQAIEEKDSAFADADHEKLADAYGVNVPWLKGEVPQYDREAMKDARGYDKLTHHDRDIVQEFAAAMPRKPPKTLAQITEERAKK